MEELTVLLVRKSAVGLLLAIVVLGAAVACANGGHQIPPGDGLSPEERLGVQGGHHRVGRDLGLTAGRDLVIDDVVVGTDLIAVRYHATGIQMIPFEQIGDNPVFAREGPTLITATADGESLMRYDGSEASELGYHWVRGEMVYRWRGGSVHHLHLSFIRIMGDEQAAWTTDLDL